jgi:hypothetical protein
VEFGGTAGNGPSLANEENKRQELVEREHVERDGRALQGKEGPMTPWVAMDVLLRLAKHLREIKGRLDHEDDLSERREEDYYDKN